MKHMIIDGNSILNRAFYGIRLLTNHEGLYTNAIYGFLATFFKLQEEERPDNVIVCFDVREKTFRHQMYDGYKAQRKGMPEELACQLPVLKEVLSCMGIVTCELAGYEADDLLGTISAACNRAGDLCVIVTGDRDSLQLLGAGTTVRLVTTKMGQTTSRNYTAELFAEEYGFPPENLVDLKALMGDASDNIPGVPGVGEKTAAALIGQFHTLENLYQNLNCDTVKNAVRKKLEAGRELALLSYRLAKIDRNAPLEKEAAELRDGPADKAGLYQLFVRLEFKNFITRLGLADEKKAREIDVRRVEDAAEMASFFAALKDAGVCAVVMPKNLEAFGAAVGTTAYVASRNEFDENLWRQSVDALFSGDYAIAMHDAKETVLALKEAGYGAEGIVFDTCIGAYLLSPTDNSFTLYKTAAGYLQREIPEAVYEADDAFSPFGEEEASVCALADHCTTVYELYELLDKKLEEQGMKELFSQIEMPLLYILGDMQHTGILLDQEQLGQYGHKLSERLMVITEHIYELAGETFNINSPKKLGEILFERLGLPAVKKTKTGYSTNIDVLEAIQGYHPIVPLIIEYRQLSKLISTYVDGLRKVVSRIDGRVHSHFQQTVTATGRLSSTDPNMQNIPVRTELGSELRRMFVAPPGYVLIDADYSQIELRVLAHIAEDETMTKAFREGVDIHAVTASQVFGVPLDEVTGSMRSRAKAVNFGIVYGISEFSLAGDIGVSRKEAGEYIKSYLRTYRGVARYMEQIKKTAAEQGYVESLFGRRRYLPELQSKNFNIRSFGERVALNTPIQATAADIIKIAMIRVCRRLRRENLKSRLVLQVHDELILEAPQAEADRVTAILKEEMEQAFPLRAPLVADAAYGADWYEAKHG